MLPAARSLLLWLTRHAAHIRDLTISFEEEAIADRSKLEALVHACLGACAAGGALEALQVQGVLMRYLAWLPALRSLQLVLVDSWQEEVMLPVGTEALTQLLCMELSCNKLSFEPSARLPPSLVTLRLMDESTEMPPQVRFCSSAQGVTGCCCAFLCIEPHVSCSQRLLQPGLTCACPICELQVAAVCGLRHLTIEEAHYSSESMAALSRLTGLTHLDCNHCHHLPPDLGVLTTLRNLYLHLRVESPAAQLDPHLQRLQQLTCLVRRCAIDAMQKLVPRRSGSLLHCPSWLLLMFSAKLLSPTCCRCSAESRACPSLWAACRSWSGCTLPTARQRLMRWHICRTACGACAG